MLATRVEVLQHRYVWSKLGFLQEVTTGWGPRSIAFSCLISGLTMVYGRYNELVNGDYNVYKPTYNWGAPSCIHGVYKPTDIPVGDHPVAKLVYIPITRTYGNMIYLYLENHQHIFYISHSYHMISDNKPQISGW